VKKVEGKAELTSPRLPIKIQAVVTPLFDWVLAANHPYLGADGTTPIGTDANIVFTFSLTNFFGVGSGEYWTGMTLAWVENSDCDDS